MQDVQPAERAGGVFRSACIEPGDIRPRRAGDHEDGQGEFSRGQQFGFRGAAAGVFGDDPFDAFLEEHFFVGALRERAARGDDFCAGRQGFGRWGVDAADDVVVPRGGNEGGEVLAADGEQHAAQGGAAQSGGGLHHVRHLGPAITLLGPPGRALDHQQRDFCAPGCRDGVVADLRGERMRRQDQRLEGMVRDILREAGNATEAADAAREWRQNRRGCASGERQHRTEPDVVSQKTGEGGGFRGAAEDQKFELWHG